MLHCALLVQYVVRNLTQIARDHIDHILGIRHYHTATAVALYSSAFNLFIYVCTYISCTALRVHSNFREKATPPFCAAK